MVERDDILRELKAFFVKELLEGEDEGLNEKTPLLKLGLINSMSIVMLAEFLQHRFAIEVPTKDLRGEVLQNLEAIAALVLRLRQG